MDSNTLLQIVNIVVAAVLAYFLARLNSKQNTAALKTEQVAENLQVSKAETHNLLGGLVKTTETIHRATNSDRDRADARERALLEKVDMLTAKVDTLQQQRVDQAREKPVT